nr:hypothetical protein [Tanacetum cinerariifolium]
VEQAVVEANFRVALREREGGHLAAGGGVLPLGGAGVGVGLLDALAQSQAGLLGTHGLRLLINNGALHGRAHLQAIEDGHAKAKLDGLTVVVAQLVEKPHRQRIVGGLARQHNRIARVYGIALGVNDIERERRAR